MAKSSPIPEQLEVAELLASKAAGDFTDYPKTHDLDFLVALAGKNEIALPAGMADVGWLTPWAAEFRYDDAPLDTLDRDQAIEISEMAVTWCRDLIAGA